jgi:hypothetical protein
MLDVKVTRCPLHAPLADRKLRPRNLTSRTWSRTAAEYSNVMDRQRLRETSSGRRLAPTTVDDLGAESSHRGVRGSAGLLPLLDSRLKDENHPCRMRAEILIPRRLRPSSGTVCPAVYKTAALPTELHRRVIRCTVADPSIDVPILSLVCEPTHLRRSPLTGVAEGGVSG